jgi:rhodanese-related sulfurtransferase/DNA-binding transcriptional ArsR family regulator
MNEQRRAKDELYELFARVANGLANAHRLELVDLLVQAPRTVEELASEAGMSLANTSQHLQRLKGARLVVDEREGLRVRYRLADPEIARLWLEMRRVAERQLAEVGRALDAYRDRRHEYEQVTIDQLRERLLAGDAILVDVRPAIEYDAGHLPGAISMPLSELELRMHEVPPGKQVIAYCRGPYCVYADQALERFSSQGRKVARLEEGVPEWQSAGLPLER